MLAHRIHGAALPMLLAAPIAIALSACAGRWDPRRSCDPPYVGPVEGESYAIYFGRGPGYDVWIDVAETSASPTIVLRLVNPHGVLLGGWAEPIHGWWCRPSRIARLRNPDDGHERLAGLETVERGRLRLSDFAEEDILLFRVR